MEEKERYTIESFEIEEPPVIFDNKIQQIILTLVDYNYDEITHLKNLLNHYFKRVKELESEVKVGEFWHSAYQGKQLDYDMVYAELRKVMDENQQLKEQLEETKQTGSYQVMLMCQKENILLKQSQKQLAIEELEKALVLIQNAVNLESPEYGLVGLYDAIVGQIKSLKGEKDDDN